MQEAELLSAKEEERPGHLTDSAAMLASHVFLQGKNDYLEMFKTAEKMNRDLLAAAALEEEAFAVFGTRRHVAAYENQIRYYLKCFYGHCEHRKAEILRKKTLLAIMSERLEHARSCGNEKQCCSISYCAEMQRIQKITDRVGGFSLWRAYVDRKVHHDLYKGVLYKEVGYFGVLVFKRSSWPYKRKFSFIL